MMKKFCIAALLGAALLGAAPLPFLSPAPVIDGKKGDPGWKNALRVEKFNLSRGDTRWKTTGLIGRTKTHICVAIFADYDDPSKVNNSFSGHDHEIYLDDVIETSNHFRCIDMVIDQAGSALTEKFIKELHFVLKTGTSDSRKDWFAVGEYKRLPNEVGGNDTTLPENVAGEMRTLLADYNARPAKTFEDIVAFHVAFERIHPFQDGNGRVGRLILFKECLKHSIVPFIIEDDLKYFYYRGLSQWDQEKGYLMDTCLTAQDRFKAYLDYFRIGY